MQDRAIRLQLDLDAPLQAVWDAWTTPEGVRSFLAPACNVELRPGGPYEIFFNPEEPPGLRGADGQFVLAFQAPHFLSFTWNAPPTLDQVRPHHTHVTLRLESLAADRTRLTFREDGFGAGGQWDQRFEYFVKAWGHVVLPRLAYRLEHGPVDWDAERPDLDPYLAQVQSL